MRARSGETNDIADARNCGNRSTDIANISGMPSIVTKSLALPKMRKLPYVILVDKDDSVSKGFPSTSNAITLLQVKDLRIVSVDFSNDPEAIKKVIDAIVP